MANEHPRPRQGKTAKDRASGASARSSSNKSARVTWQHDAKTAFPTTSCNGKKNRHRYTGKGNTTVILSNSNKRRR